MVNRHNTRLRRAAKVMARLAGLVTVTVLAGGCSLLPFGGGPPKDARALRPEIHEVAANSQPDCLAQDDTLEADATAAEAQLQQERQPLSQPPDGQRVANASSTLEGHICALCGRPNAPAAPASAFTSVADAVESAASGAAPVMPAPAGPAGFVAASAGESELQRLMDGNKRFVEGESENVYQWPQRPGGEANRRPPAAMLLVCSDWETLPEAAFDARPGELFVVRVAGNVADAGVLHSAKYAVQRYGIPLIIVLGHESCGAVGAGLQLDVDAAEGRPAASTIRAGEAQADASKSDASTDRADAAIHANVDEAVARLRAADATLGSRIAAGRLRIVGAYYDETNGQITLQPDASLAPPVSEYVELPRD